MSSEQPSWAIVVPRSAEDKEEPLRQFVDLLQDKCSRKGLELPHPFVYMWEDITQATLSGLDGFVDNLLHGPFDFVLCVFNTGFDVSQLPRMREDLQSAEHSAIYLPFEDIESVAVVGEVLHAMSTCFARQLSSAFECIVLPWQQSVCGGALRTFMGQTTNSQDDFIFTAKDGISISTAKKAACMSGSLSTLLQDGKAHLSAESVDARLLLLAVQWLEHLHFASSIGTIPMPPELSNEVLLNVVRSYSSRYPSLQWAEEFASVSPQWKHVIDTHRCQLPRLFVDTIKLKGCQLEIRLQAHDPQSSSGGPPQPIVLKDEAANTAATLCRIAARSLIISLEEHETLEEVLVYVGNEGLRAMTISLESPGLADANVTQVMRAIGEAERLRAKVTCTRDIEALLPGFPRFIHNFKMDLDSCRLLEDDSLLDALLYFANRKMARDWMMGRDFVIEHYSSDVVKLANRIAKRDVQARIALNIRRSDGRRCVAVYEGCGMRMIMGDDRAVNERMSRRQDYVLLRPLLDRGSSAFEKLANAVYATLFSETMGYSDLDQLLHDVGVDFGIDGEQAARDFAYKSFRDFLRSAEMKAQVNVTEDSSGRTVYEAIPTSDTVNLFWGKKKSFVSAAERSAKKATNEARDARRKVADLERRVRELELQVGRRDETIRQQGDALAEVQLKVQCPICMNAPIEVVFNCGHGACRVCAEKLTAPGTNQFGTSQFRVNGPTPSVKKPDPKCYCNESLNLCVDFYAFRS